MKINREAPEGKFTPYKITIEIETLEDQVFLETFTGRDVVIPNTMEGFMGGRAKNMTKQFLDELRNNLYL